MKKKISYVWLILIGVPLLLGLFLLSLVGYGFSAYLSFGLSAIFGVYGLFSLSTWSGIRWIRLGLSIVLAVIAILASITGFIIARAAAGTPGDCNAVIVLGAAVHGTTPSLSLKERLEAAYAYLTAHPDALCVVSGGMGNGEDISEAACMQQYLIAKGIDPSRIITEDQSTSTKENLQFSLDKLEEATGTRPQKVGIVSSEYHLYRAGRIAKSLGLEAQGIPARTTLPFLRINYFLREIAGVWYLLLFGG